MKLDVPLPAEKQFVIVWQSPDYVEPDVPVYAHDWDVLLAQARTSLESRSKAYPDWVRRGQLSQEAADADIQAWEWLVAEWHWIITGEGELPPIGSLDRRKAAVALSLERINAELRRGNRTDAIHRQAHIAMALAWHLDRIKFGAPAIHSTARFNHNTRREREAAQQQRSAA